LQLKKPKEKPLETSGRNYAFKGCFSDFIVLKKVKCQKSPWMLNLKYLAFKVSQVVSLYFKNGKRMICLI
jgi:hypothetical protein